ncbi:NAD(P)H-dependent oxidoreductase subunit E [Candidatus Izemoplasma sp. B36]|uniref:NADH-quinone oxidoreductase subunit NuoE family protein n=1 Tax=Candidatus Izemoplasma sp. B36 TaxID=3242468 RepID=UPI003555E947
MGAKIEITEEKLDMLYAAMEKNKLQPGPLMPTLHAAQNIFGCIPLPIQKIISSELDVSIARINGVVTFYGHFSIEPKGKNVISICLGTACYVKGSQGILDAFSHDLHIGVGETSKDGLFTLEATRCIGACGLAPIFTVNDEIYANGSVQLVKKVIQKYKN